ncbi:hypothetical protein EVAR_59283_1 [Eumeta japonica]|uniref:Uncharacterized protein n=1 Tax=Eumeta variegata TaxID=151549 RepID=A0A4C1SZ12_EUMVA|nr:hypothetical protein EVAR_59283_1 [Eumeta japonica]
MALGSTRAQDTEQPPSRMTQARRFLKWDAAERRKLSRRLPHRLGCQGPCRRRATCRDAARPERHQSRQVLSQPPLPEVIGEALTRSTVCRPKKHDVIEVARCIRPFTRVDEHVYLPLGVAG